MRVDIHYVSAACNRTQNICDWGKNGLICYGACNSLIIYNPKYAGTSEDLKILIKHTKRINAVKWVKCNGDTNEKEIISASSDGTAIIWSSVKEEYKPVVLKGHEDGVNLIDAIYTSAETKSLLIVTASIDSTVRIWLRKEFGDEATNIQTLNFGRGLCLALKLAFLPHTSTVLLACARDNSNIQLYSQQEENGTQEFRLSETLKGHENWVCGLDFTTDDSGNVFLASCAQDTFIRIWCISQSSDEKRETSVFDRLASHKMRAMESKFSVVCESGPREFSVHLESVLCGHDGWVYAVSWMPKISRADGTLTQQMKILSSSLDKSMVIWSLDESSGLWMETVRVGEVGGNTLGFYGSKFSSDGQSILGHGYLGSFHLWNLNQKTNSWEPGVTVGGHSNEVIDLAWEPEGEFVVSVSLDQTTRIHAPWVAKDSDTVSWHELARPQVHGYDMSCLALLSRYKFVSGAEEKIVRAFQAPSNFVANFRRICNIDEDAGGQVIFTESNGGPRGASVPSLGLSNKAVYDYSNEENQPKGKNSYAEDSYFHEVQLEAPPTEEDLLQNTLWPELQKLYGHGYEVFALAASYDGNLIASACKATTPEHASVILWDTNTWHQLQKLSSHTLTVTQIMFSPDNTRILSVSRDRRWTIFEKDAETNEYKVAATTDKKTGIHARIIWCCAWSFDSKYFATGSRDGKAVIWWRNEGKDPTSSNLGQYESVNATLDIKGQSITAIAFAPVLVDSSYLLCLGLESGLMLFYNWSLEKSWKKSICLDESSAHHLTVKRIFFRPKLGMAGVSKSHDRVLQIASCSADHSVKIHNVYLD